MYYQSIISATNTSIGKTGPIASPGKTFPGIYRISEKPVSSSESMHRGVPILSALRLWGWALSGNSDLIRNMLSIASLMNVVDFEGNNSQLSVLGFPFYLIFGRVA